MITILVYLASHFLVYALVLKHRKAFSKERNIFLYHFLSEVFVTMVVLGITTTSMTKVALVVWTMSLHGIYSLSFLCLWASSDGGYSLRIMNYIDKANKARRPISVEAMRQLGSSKKEDRIESLSQLKLIRQEGGAFEVTPLGRSLVLGLSFIAFFGNAKRVL